MIERAIHEIINDASIADAVALLALLPAARITTGANHDRDLPYASINLESNQAEYRSNDATARNCRIRFSLWHENHYSGSQIADAIEKLFENKSFETTSHTILQSRHENTLTLQEEDGVWQFVIDFIFVTHKD
jgi:hypothetical protein